MPTLANHQSNDYTKLLLIGDSKSGKTGSLISLLKAGYKLRILDMDNLLEILKNLIYRECPELIENVEFRTLRDKTKAGSLGIVSSGTPKAWINAIKMLDRWKYVDNNGVEKDLGVPAEWGSDYILVIDSLSRLCDAAYAFHEAIIPVGKSGDYDQRAVYKNAQDDVEKFVANLTSEGMETNVIVIAHVAYQVQPDKTMKGFPQGVGKALSPKIPQYFPSVVLYTKKGEKRTIQTNSTALVDLANPKPFEMQPSYPIETGLAQFFEVLREVPKVDKPKSLTIKRVV